MKSYLYFIQRGIFALVFLGFSFEVLAQPSFSNGLLWEITPSGSTIRSYLYGTIHVRDEKVFAYSDSVTICFNQATYFASEVVMNSSTSRAMAKKIFLPNNTSLKQLIGEVYYKNLKKYFKENKFGAYNLMINRMKPIWVAGLVSQATIPKDKGVILDLYFQKLAIKQNKKLHSLELIDQQLEAIDSLSIDLQIDILKKTIDDFSIKNSPSSDTFTYESLLSAYLSQDLTQIETIINSDTTDFAMKFIDNLLSKRNYRMLDRINELCSQVPTFIAVGAAHLPGQQGLLNLLFQKGYLVRPIFSPFKK
ncbi:MAG: TraB/GumN family protein [Cytophagales bacterium]|nr:MAG: TraB/GumN family protein [Cytophagales bacterium]